MGVFKQIDRINNLVESGAELSEMYNHKILTKKNVNDKSYLTIFRGRSAKPLYNYYFKSVDILEKWLNNFLEREKREHEKDLKSIEERNQKVNNIKIGDIFYCSWGWEQTNINYYQIVGKKGKETFLLRELKQNKVEDNAHLMSAIVEPIKDNFHTDEILTRRFSKYGSFKISECQSAKVWSGVPREATYYA